VAAQTGHHVTIVEINEDAIKKAKNGIESSLQRVAKKLYKVCTYSFLYCFTRRGSSMEGKFIMKVSEYGKLSAYVCLV
jgi:hypothetical protein